MTTSPSDYSWIDSYRGGLLLESYCLTLIQGISSEEFFHRIKADAQGTHVGFDALRVHSLNAHPPQVDSANFGVTTVTGHGDSWVMVVEDHARVGADYGLMGQATVMTWGISHHASMAGRRSFSWWDGGDMRTWFEWPSRRPRSAPEALLEAINRIGITEDPQMRVAEHFALAEQLTGVRITGDLLDEAIYLAGVVTLPREETLASHDREITEPMSRERAQEIREWARSRGIKVTDRGQIPENIASLYNASH